MKEIIANFIDIIIFWIEDIIQILERIRTRLNPLDLPYPPISLKAGTTLRTPKLSSKIENVIYDPLKAKEESI